MLVKRQKLQHAFGTISDAQTVDLEYVPEDSAKAINDEHFKGVFEHFRYDPSLREKELEPHQTIEEMFPDLKQPILQDQDSGEEDTDSQQPLSKKKARKLNRIPLATLKTLFKRPEIIEVHVSFHIYSGSM